MTNETVAAEALQINEANIYRQGGSLFFTATALTEDFVPLEIQREYAWTGKGKEARWRHITPESNVNALIGHMHEVWVENGKLKAIVEVWGYKDSLKKIQQQIIDGELSVSLGYKTTKDDQDNVIGIYIREISLTPSPKCTPQMGCGIESVFESESLVLNEMPNEALEMLEKTLVSQNKERGERIVELESAIEAMEDRINEGNKIINEQQEKIESLEAELHEVRKEAKSATTLSIRQEIIKMQEITDEEAVKAELESLAELDADQLTLIRDRIKRALDMSVKVKKEPPILGSGEGVQQNEDDAEALALRLNPELKELVEKNQRRTGRAGPPGFGSGDDVPIITGGS